MRRSSLILPLAVIVLTSTTHAQAPDLNDLLARISDRVGDFYKRAQSLICDEKVTAQSIRRDMGPEGFARTVEYDLRIESASAEDEASDANFVRDLRKINGRAPKPRDAKDWNACRDPEPATPEPLKFLLARNRDEYVFSWAGYGKGKDQNTLLIDYRPVTEVKPSIQEAKNGLDGCYQLTLPSDRRGRIWIDAQNYDVLRIEQGFVSRLDIRIPWVMQRRDNLPDSIVVDRFQVVTRYKRVAFKDPDETLLLPASIEELVMVHGLQSHRVTQTFSNYRRFMTGGRIVR